MTSAPQTYPDWKAPREDGSYLLWPPANEFLGDTLENQKRLSACDARVQGVALGELRRRARQWIGHDDAIPLLADGHQTELHHSGVWVKRVLTHLAASRLGGSAVHFAVDTDAPKHLTLRWIGGSDPITDDPNLTKAHWTGQLDAPSPAHLQKVESDLSSAKFQERPIAFDFLTSLRRLAIEQPLLPAALTNAMHELDWSLGLRHHAMLTSPIWSSETFLIFAHHIVARVGEYAKVYNAALADYRREKKVRTKTRPMPDLATFEESIELPFWMDELETGNRTRPSAFARDGGFVMTAPGARGDEFDFDPNADAFDAAKKLSEWLMRSRLRLSPRALTLTTFLRLFVADQFVHGIGGAQYDQVADRIIAAHFGFKPPRFSVVTGTLYLPEAVDRSRVCVACIVQEGHRLRHSLLGERKKELIAGIEASPRKSAERYAAFASMHRELATAARTSLAIQRWEKHLQETRAQEMEEIAIFDRELFYALQPGSRLNAMIAQFSRTLES